MVRFHQRAPFLSYDMDLPSWVFRGAKVVCVDNSVSSKSNSFKDPTEWPVVGQIYTIKDIFVQDVSWAIDLEEICRTEFAMTYWSARGLRAGYGLYRFRPVKTVETDMEEHFQKFLDTQIPADVV